MQRETKEHLDSSYLYFPFSGLAHLSRPIRLLCTQSKPVSLSHIIPVLQSARVLSSREYKSTRVQNIDPPPPHRPASVYPPAFGAGGGQTLWVERGVGVSIFWKTPDTALYYICKYFVPNPSQITSLDPGYTQSPIQYSPSPRPLASSADTHREPATDFWEAFSDEYCR